MKLNLNGVLPMPVPPFLERIMCILQCLLISHWAHVSHIMQRWTVLVIFSWNSYICNFGNCFTIIPHHFGAGFLQNVFRETDFIADHAMMTVKCAPIISPLIARFMGPTWGPSGADRFQMGPILAPRTLLSRAVYFLQITHEWHP